MIFLAWSNRAQFSYARSLWILPPGAVRLSPLGVSIGSQLSGRLWNEEGCEKDWLIPVKSLGVQIDRCLAPRF